MIIFEAFFYSHPTQVEIILQDSMKDTEWKLLLLIFIKLFDYVFELFDLFASF